MGGQRNPRDRGVYDLEAEERAEAQERQAAMPAGDDGLPTAGEGGQGAISSAAGPSAAGLAADGPTDPDDHRVEGEPAATPAPRAEARVELISEGAVPAPPPRPVVRHTLSGVEMAVDIGPDVTIPNPVLTASGCAANGRELHRFFDVADLGAFTTKTVMREPRAGRGTPRMAETPGGMLNSIGLQGPGIEAFVATDLAWLKSVGARVLVSIAGTEPAEFAEVTRVLRNSEAFDACVGVEVNISCPNVANRGLVYACDVASTTQVLEQVRTELPPDVPAFAKLTPDVTDIVAIAAAALAAGATGLTMINTLLGMDIDTDRLRPRLYGVTGGLSGPAIRPVAVRAVFQVAAAMRAGILPIAPIIGVGGIASGLDALQFLAAGATAVQVGTATFHDPLAPVKVRDELAAAVAARGYATIGEVIGVAHDRLP